MEINPEDRDDQKGFLKKLKSSSVTKIFGNTNLRYFELSYKTQMFGYKVNPQDRYCKINHKFSEITDFKDRIPELEKTKSDWKFGFRVIISEKQYILFAQNEQDLKNWIFAFNIVLKRIPEAFPKIQDIAFQAALNIFYLPYLKEKERLAEEKRREKERRLREEEERRKKALEEQERLRKEMEERRRLLEEEEEKRRRQQREMEEELKRKSNKFRLYDEYHQSIFREAQTKSEQVIEEDKIDISLPNSLIKEIENKKNQPSKEFRFKEKDIYDWNYYDGKEKLIKEEELINFNPILTKQNQKLGVAFHSVIKGYVDPNLSRSQLHLESMHIPKASNLDQSLNNSKNLAATKYYESFTGYNLKDEVQTNKQFSLANSIVAQAKYQNLEQAKSNSNSNNQRNSMSNNLVQSNKDLQTKGTITKDQLLKFVPAENRSKTPIKHQTTLLDVEYVKKDKNEVEVTYKLKDVDIRTNVKSSQNIAEKSGEQKKKLSVKKNEDKINDEDSNSSIISNEGEIHKPVRFSNFEKKKIFEKLYFNIDDSTEKNNGDEEKNIPPQKTLPKKNANEPVQNDYRLNVDPQTNKILKENLSQSIPLNPNLNPKANISYKNGIFGDFNFEQENENPTNNFRSSLKSKNLNPYPENKQNSILSSKDNSNTNNKNILNSKEQLKNNSKTNVKVNSKNDIQIKEQERGIFFG